MLTIEAIYLSDTFKDETKLTSKSKNKYHFCILMCFGDNTNYSKEDSKTNGTLFFQKVLFSFSFQTEENKMNEK